MTPKAVPQDSLLAKFITYMSVGETPLSYQIAGGLSCIGALVRRNRWIDQVDWRVYPNQSVMFIGPSGIGKDTIINRIQSTLQHLEPFSRVPTLGGCTIEVIHAQLAKLPKPAAAYIPAAEITAFFGKADYQANMLTGITNLLSNGAKVDISTKGSYMSSDGRPTVIYEPTLTMHAGSTVEWLHKGMPDGTLEGGFLGRFLIVCEELGSRHVPLVKQGRTKEHLAWLRTQIQEWRSGLERIVATCKHPREMVLLDEAEDLYTNWYYNRFRMFSRAVMPYANRSRDMVLRLAMLMALSRGHDRYVEGEDVAFAIDMIREIAERIDRVVLPPSKEAALRQLILARLPATDGELVNEFGQKYGPTRDIRPAIRELVDIGQARWDRGTKVLHRIGD